MVYLGNSDHSIIFEIEPKYWQLTPVFLPGKSHEWRSLVGYSPWDRKESDTTEQLHFHCILNSFIDYEGFPISSKQFLPTVIDLIVLRIKFAHSSPF